MRAILERYQPNKLIVFSRDELKQYEIAQLYAVFNGVDYIIHAAALKHVPTAEYNPFEAVKTNVLGTQNVIRAATNQRVKKVIALSTDKAASPLSLQRPGNVLCLFCRSSGKEKHCGDMW